MTPTLSPADLYHVGVVVDDVEAAKAQMTAALGLTWGFQAETEMPVLLADGVVTIPFHLAYSAPGPVRVELVHAVPGTPWEVAAGAQAHHLGYWATDVARTSATLAAAGLPRVAKVGATSEADPTSVVFHKSRHGPYIEVVDVAMRAMMFPDDPA